MTINKLAFQIKRTRKHRKIHQVDSEKRNTIPLMAFHCSYTFTINEKWPLCREISLSNAYLCPLETASAYTALSLMSSSPTVL